MFDNPDLWHGAARVLARLQVYVSQFELLVIGVALICGIVFMVIGLRRAALRAEMGPGQGSWAGPISWLLAGIVLIALPRFLTVLSQSVFADPLQREVGDILALAPDMVSFFQEDMSLQTIQGILRVVQLIGLIAVVRGIFILNSAVQPGTQAGIGAGITHLIGGIFAYNVVLFMEVLNELFK